MAVPNKEELEVLTKFRASISDLKLAPEDDTDINLLRYLRARNLDLSKAESMLRNNINWRKENEMDKIMTEFQPPPLFHKLFRYEFTGFSHDGCPISHVPFGVWDVKKVADRGEKDLFVKYFYQYYERAMHLMKGRIDPITKLPVTQCIAVFDFKHYSFKQLTALGAVTSVLTCLTTFEVNYPEILRTAYILNAPRIFSIFLSMIKPVLSARTYAKIAILSTDEAKMKAILNEALPKEAILEKWGGSCKYSVLNHYGQTNQPIREGEVKDSIIENEDSSDEFIPIAIDAGQVLNLEFEVEEPLTTISWSFKTQGFDIGFSLKFRGEEVVKNTRVDSHIETSIGSYICKKPGKYIMTFDNSYSRLRNKTLYYLVNFYLPDSDVEED